MQERTFSGRVGHCFRDVSFLKFLDEKSVVRLFIPL